MGHIVVKKVRLDDDYAKRLAKIAKSRGITESDVLRAGIDLLDFQQRQRRGLDGLIEMAKIGHPDKERYAFK